MGLEQRRQGLEVAAGELPGDLELGADSRATLLLRRLAQGGHLESLELVERGLGVFARPQNGEGLAVEPAQPGHRFLDRRRVLGRRRGAGGQPLGVAAVALGRRESQGAVGRGAAFGQHLDRQPAGRPAWPRLPSRAFDRQDVVAGRHRWAR